jgi:hypothetical protein
MAEPKPRAIVPKNMRTKTHQGGHKKNVDFYPGLGRTTDEYASKGTGKKRK